MPAPQAPAVLQLDTLDEIVEAVRREGAFAFDVEARGTVDHHPDVLEHIERQWAAKQSKLKTTIPSVIERSKQTIIDKWNENMGLDWYRNEVFWLGIAVSGQSWAIPMGHPNGEVLVKELRGDGTTVPPPGYRGLTNSGKESKAKAKFHVPAVFTPPPEQLTQEQVFSVLEPIFMDPDIVKINQSINFDAKSIAKYFGGKLPQGMYVNVEVLQHILNENFKEYNLVANIERLFKYNPYEVEGKLGKTIQHEPFSAACRYVHMDVRWAWLAYKASWRRISRHEMLFNTLQYDLNACRPLAQMEYNGIPINNNERLKVGRELEQQINMVMMELLPLIPQKLFPNGFNPAAPNDKKKLLFTPKSEGGLGFKPTKVSKKTNEPSVDQEVLESFKGKHQIIDVLLKYAELAKIKSTYIDGVEDLLYPGPTKDIKILRPNLNQSRTVTGRLSSSEPNLQNVSRESNIRSMFVPGPGRVFVVADYSQIEPRIYAAYSQDPELLRVYREGLDLYNQTAQLILGRPHETAEERVLYGKVPWLALSFGGSGYRIFVIANGKITEEQADEIAEQFWNSFAGLKKWKKKVTAQAKQLGYCETLGGRRRRLPDINSDDWKLFSRAERQLHNMYTQGTAAEICKEAIANVDKLMDNDKYKLHLQVHDELIVSVPEDEGELWVPRIKEAMGDGRMLTIGDGEGVPLVVKAHAGQSWAEGKD